MKFRNIQYKDIKKYVDVLMVGYYRQLEEDITITKLTSDFIIVSECGKSKYVGIRLLIFI